MKKLFISFLMLSGMASVMAQDPNIPVSSDGYYQVSSLQQLKDALLNVQPVNGTSSANIRLTADIYLSDDEAASTLIPTFKGKLDGDGHTIWAARPEVQHDGGGHYKRSPLFDYCIGASVSNITFKNIRVQDKEDNGVIAMQAHEQCVFENITFDNVSLYGEMANVGAVVAQANSCEFKDIKVLNSDFCNDDTWIPEFITEESISQRYVGGVVGFAVGCTFYNVETNNSEISGVYNIGGVIGKVMQCRIENTYTKGCFINASERSAGGISGESEHDNYFTNCQVDDQTCIFCDGNGSGANSGGIVGSSWRTDQFYNCINSALVTADDDYIAGIVGYGAPLVIDHCMNTGILMSIDGDDVKGVYEKYKSKSFGTPITTITYNGKEYQVQQLDETSKDLVDNDHYLGGIAGNSAVLIKNCMNYAPIYSKGDCVGGILGYVIGGQVINCINAPSAIDGFPDADETHGGIIGKVRKTGTMLSEHITTIMCCLNLNGLRMMGEAEDGGYSGTSNYSNSSSHSSIDMPITIDMVNSGLLAYWMNQNVEVWESDYLQPWRQNLSGEHNTLPSFDPTLNEVVNYDYLIRSTPAITTPDMLQEFVAKVNEGHNPGIAFLGADITMPTNYNNHQPIGTKAHPFIGIFDGLGHTIKGLRVEISSDEEGAGLFGVVTVNTTIRNVIVDDLSDVINHKDAGAAGIVGLVHTSNIGGDIIIEKCASSARVSANKHAGGILGRVMTGEDGGPSVRVYINNCSNVGTITASNGNSGLLCGYAKKHGHISNCWSAGYLKTTDKSKYPFSIVNPKNEYEYLAGYDETIDIQNCYILASADNIDRYDEDRMQSGVATIDEYSLSHGEFTYQLNGNTNDVSKSLSWQQELGVDPHPMIGGKGLYHKRDIHKDKYGTVCVPYQLKSDEHVTYYTFVSDEIEDGDLKLNFEYAETVPAGIAALCLPAEDMIYDFLGTGDTIENNKITESQTPGSDWKFVGYYIELALSDESTTQHIYYIKDNTIRNAKQVTIPPYRAFFYGPSIGDLRETLGNQGAARVRLVIDGEENEAAALQLVTDDVMRSQNAKAYTLFGTEAGEGYRGNVVRDGKKVFSVNN